MCTLNVLITVHLKKLIKNIKIQKISFKIILVLSFNMIYIYHTIIWSISSIYDQIIKNYHVLCIWCASNIKMTAGSECYEWLRAIPWGSHDTSVII